MFWKGILKTDNFYRWIRKTLRDKKTKFKPRKKLFFKNQEELHEYLLELTPLWVPNTFLLSNMSQVYIDSILLAFEIYFLTLAVSHSFNKHESGMPKTKTSVELLFVTHANICLHFFSLCTHFIVYCAINNSYFGCPLLLLRVVHCKNTFNGFTIPLESNVCTMLSLRGRMGNIIAHTPHGAMVDNSILE